MFAPADGHDAAPESGPYLTLITDLAAAVVPGALAASVTLLADPDPRTPSFTGELAWDLDQQQYRLRGGPGLLAAVDGGTVEVVDARTDARWPAYAAAAAARGSLSSLSVSLTTAGGPQAALNLYGQDADAFGGAGARRAAAQIAAAAAAGLVAVRHAELSAACAEGLRQVMSTRATIEQAKGILMERGRITASAAFELLTIASQHSNRKLRDVAAQLVDTGELPAA